MLGKLTGKVRLDRNLALLRYFVSFICLSIPCDFVCLWYRIFSFFLFLVLLCLSPYHTYSVSLGHTSLSAAQRPLVTQ